METPVVETEPRDCLEQAAIVLLCMGEKHAANVLNRLSRPALLRVTRAMASLRGVKVGVVSDALKTFFEHYREQSGVRGASRHFLQRSLGMALGNDIANTVLNSVYGDSIRPKMARLQWLSPRWIAEQIAAEHMRMQALFLAFLPPPLAGQVIEALPEESRESLLLNIAKFDEIDHELLIELDELVEQCMSTVELQGTSIQGVRQAADIINHLHGDRLKMIELLRDRDPGVVTEIVGSMYSFEMLSRQSDATLARIIEAVPIEQWAVAVKGAPKGVLKALQRTMPRRQVQAFEDAQRRLGALPASRIERMRKEIMARVKELADGGEIEVELIAEDMVA